MTTSSHLRCLCRARQTCIVVSFSCLFLHFQTGSPFCIEVLHRAHSCEFPSVSTFPSPLFRLPLTSLFSTFCPFLLSSLSPLSFLSFPISYSLPFLQLSTLLRLIISLLSFVYLPLPLVIPPFPHTLCSSF